MFAVGINSCRSSSRFGSALCGEGRGSATGRDNHGHLTTNEISRQRGQTIVLALCPAVFDREVPALDIARFAQAAVICPQTARP
jgi:hypothetical protein